MGATLSRVSQMKDAPNACVSVPGKHVIMVICVQTLIETKNLIPTNDVFMDSPKPQCPALGKGKDVRISAPY